MTAEQDTDRHIVLPEGVLTGEAVSLELRPASFASRLLASLLDALVLAVLLLGLGAAALFGLINLDDAGSAALSLVLTVGILLGVPVTIETVTRGRSLGKLAAGLRVVRDDGGPIRFRQALVRGLLAVPEIYLTSGSIALITSLVTPRGQRIGDLLAGTFVIRERAGHALPPPAPMPPHLAAWASGADLGPLPDTLAMAARQFLGRAGGLGPSSRVRLGAGLAGDVAAYVSPSPPAGTDPESFLAAVLAERRRRDLARLQARAAVRSARNARYGRTSVLRGTGLTLLVQEGDTAPRKPPM